MVIGSCGFCDGGRFLVGESLSLSWKSYALMGLCELLHVVVCVYCVLRSAMVITSTASTILVSRREFRGIVASC